MTSAASNYHESSQFIHQRYEDTAIIIFHQQQKIRQDERRRAKQSNSLYPKPLTYKHQQNFVPLQQPQQPQQPHHRQEFSRYGNQPVFVKETATVPSPTGALQREKVLARPESGQSVTPGGSSSVKSS